MKHFNAFRYNGFVMESLIALIAAMRQIMFVKMLVDMEENSPNHMAFCSPPYIQKIIQIMQTVPTQSHSPLAQSSC